MKPKGAIDSIAWITLLGLSIIWGSSFILIKKALIAFDPAVMGSLRIVISSMAFIPVLIYNRNKIEWSKWPLYAAVGITGTGIPSYMYAIAQTEITSSVAGLLNSLTPIFTLVLGLIFFSGIFSLSKLSGVIIGFTGAASLLLFTREAVIGGNPLFGLFVVVGTLCYGTSVNIVKRYFQNIRPVIISAVSFGFVGFPALIYLIFSDFLITMENQPGAAFSLGAVFILAMAGTVAASIVFFKLVQTTNAVFASSVAYLMPIIALIWGMLDGEVISLLHVLSLLLILTGVYLIKKE